MTKRSTESLLAEAERINAGEAARRRELEVRRRSMATILARRRPELFRPYMFAVAIVLDGVGAVDKAGTPSRGLFPITDLPTLELIDKALEALLDEVS